MVRTLPQTMLLNVCTLSCEMSDASSVLMKIFCNTEQNFFCMCPMAQQPNIYLNCVNCHDREAVYKLKCLAMENWETTLLHIQNGVLYSCITIGKKNVLIEKHEVIIRISVPIKVIWDLALFHTFNSAFFEFSIRTHPCFSFIYSVCFVSLLWIYLYHCFTQNVGHTNHQFYLSLQ